MRCKQLTPFQKALVESVLDEYKDIPAESEIQYTFSPKFMQWFYKINRKSNTKTWHYINSPLKKLILFAIMISLLTVTALAVPAIREAIIDFFVVEREEGVYAITFDPEEAAKAPREVETYYGPTNIPENFMLIIDEKTTAGVCLLWMNDNGEMICYDQNYIPQNATYTNWMGINAEGTTRESMIVNGYAVEIFYMNGSYTICWTDNSYVYSVELSETIPFTVFENILASMTVLE